MSSMSVAEVEANSSRFRVLVAEDNPSNQMLLKMILGCLGGEVDCVENGAEAVAASRHGKYDAIFMDVQMPVMDGLTAIRQIRKHERDGRLDRTPIFTVTANALPEHVWAALDAGADRQISKPVSPPMILAALEEALTEKCAA
jgi:CheY-like chemotaxis protein